MREPTFDADGYPTDETLARITAWEWSEGWGDLLAFVRRVWTYHDYFTVNGSDYRISTGGWSGNEELIGALKANVMFWSLCWVSSRRGGHYEFEVRAVLAADTAAPHAATDPAARPGR